MKTRLLILFALLTGHMAFSQAPRLYLIDAKHLAAERTAFRKGDTAVKNAVSKIIAAADECLDSRPLSVMEKAFTPPSGSKHDYMSMAPYFWPDPAKADGLPYIRKDGQRNPEIKKISDHDYLSDLDNKCRSLSLAYYFSGDNRYAAKAAQLLNVWFIDSATRMNPNLNYAQAIKGINDGRGIGIIETRSLATLADWMGLLEGAAAFKSLELAAIKSWYKEYLNWMLTSKNGRDEHLSKNNHGTHYDVQAATFALFTGNEALARKILAESRNRIAVQIEPDGKQPLELARTNAYGYSTMNISGWFNLATLAQKTGIDIWNYTTADGRNIKKALDWLIPYALGEKPKDHQQISPYNTNELYRLLLQAATVYHDPAYTAKAARIADNNSFTDLIYN